VPKISKFGADLMQFSQKNKLGHFLGHPSIDTFLSNSQLM